MSQPFVSTAWLQEHLNDPDLVVVDGSWYLPTQNRDPQAEYLAGHIPGAVRFDIDTREGHLLRPCPTCCLRRRNFAQAVGAMGIGEDMTIVVYDGAGLFAAPRVRWTFQVFGARNVSILEGGFPAWKAEGRPVETGPETAARPANLQALLRRRPWSRMPRPSRRRCDPVRRRWSMPGPADRFQRRSARAAPRPAHRPYSGKPQPALRPRSSRTAG